MKKKSLIVLITLTLVIALFGLVGLVSAGQPAGKRAQFEADIIPVDTQPLEKGEVWIRSNGNFKVDIEGAAASEIYEVYLLYGDPTNPESIKLGELETDEDGDDKLYEVEYINCGIPFGNPWIEIRLEGDVHYVSGFILDSCPDPGPGPMEY